MANLFAIEIMDSTLELIALLNNGVQPAVEEKRTFFILDVTWNSGVPPEILAQSEMAEKYDLDLTHPVLLNLKKL